MRVSIVVPDNIVIVDGVARTVDMTGVEPFLHAVQWHGTTGEAEYGKPLNSNVPLTDLSAYQFLVDRWAAVVPPPPPPPPTKDDWVQGVFGNPALRAVILELAARLGVTDETQLKALIKNRMP